ncbi:permease [Psychrobacillus sp. PGGUH221]|uniref:permease n=1 Tax=Psychrobacillus sp. PGGUH221 TaxID=3020058 RepID=UPI0035C66538
MFAGHFGISATVKSKTPETPLWSLIVSTQLLDIVFIPFILVGLENIESIGDGGYGNDMIYAFYTHSLVGSLILSILAALLAKRLWGRKSGIIIGAVVFSHWILDFIVHRPDMPILPGNIGNLPLLGLGLWETVPGSVLLEALLLAIGCFFYFSYALKKEVFAHKGKGIMAGCAMTAFLLLSFYFGISL